MKRSGSWGVRSGPVIFLYCHFLVRTAPLQPKSGLNGVPREYYWRMKDSGAGVLGFVAQVIGSLVWPVTVLTCVLLLRKHLLALIPLVRTVKYSDVEIRFGQEVAELAKSVDAAAVPAQTPQAGNDKWEELMRMAEVRPRTAIRMAFRRVEEAITEAARARNVEIADGAQGMPMVIGAILLNNGVISTAQYDLLSRLRRLVMDAELAPSDGITAESASDFVSLAMRLAGSVAV